MGRRTSDFEELMIGFRKKPWWFPLIIAVAVFCLVYFVFPLIASLFLMIPPPPESAKAPIQLIGPMHEGMKIMVEIICHMVGVTLAFMILLAGVFSWIWKLFDWVKDTYLR